MVASISDVFPERLRQLREYRGFSTRQLADKIGKSQQLISKLENRVVRPSLETVEELAVALNVRIAYFFEDDPELGEQMPLDILLKNYDPDIREFLSNDVPASHIALLKEAKSANLTDDDIKVIINLIKRQK